MRIAVSGTHRAGKSTLVRDLADQLRGYRVVDERYRLLEEEGFEFSDPTASCSGCSWTIRSASSWRS